MNSSLLVLGWIFLFAVYPAAAESCNATSYQTKVVCFISASSARFSYDRLGSNLCTHYILIDLAIVNCEGSLALVEQSIPALSSFLAFKDRLREIDDVARFILAVGGSNQESSDFTKAIDAERNLVALTEDIVDFVKRHDLDGVDIAWFNPGETGEFKADRINLIRFLHELHLGLGAGASLSLTAALNPELFDIRSVDVYVDFVNLLTVDFHDPKKPSHVAPLYSQDPEDLSSVFRSVQIFVKAGLNPQKIVVLTSTIGYLYTLKFCFLESKVTVKSIEKLSKHRVQEALDKDNFYISWDDIRQVPYGSLSQGILEKKWITFSDLKSHRLKADFVRKYQLGGIGVYTLDQEAEEARSCQPGIPFSFLWTLVDTVRPQKDFANPPLLGLSEDYAIQYVPRQQAVNTPSENGNECASESIVDIPYKNIE